MAIITPLTCTGIVSIVITAVLAPVTLFALVARLASRRIKKKSLTWDDYLIALGFIFANAMGACSITAVLAGGMGHHAGDLSPSDLSTLLKLFIASLLCWVLTMTSVKLSILILYIHTFTIRPFLRTAYAVIALVLAFFIATVLVTFLNCRPFSKSWNPSPFTPGTCGDIAKENLAVVITNMILDVIVVVLPMPVVWRLQMRLGKKLAVMGIFGAGVVICVFSALRIYATVGVVERDFPATAVWVSIWGQLEVDIAVIAACAPVCQPFFATIWKGLASWGSEASKATRSITGDRKSSKKLEAEGAGAGVAHDRYGFGRLGSTAPVVDRRKYPEDEDDIELIERGLAKEVFVSEGRVNSSRPRE